MPSLPRIITVDPTGNVARIVRAAIDLSDYACRQIDVPSGSEAIEEMQLGSCDLLVTSLNLEDMQVFDFAEQAKRIKENVAIIVLVEETDPTMDLSSQHEHGFVYLQRPLDIHQFSQVMFAGMSGKDIFDALQKPVTAPGAQENMGPVPSMDVERAREIIDQLLLDLGAMSILLLGRDGKVMLERGSANFVNPDGLVRALIPSIRANIDMRDIVGGDSTTLQFYDGDQRDVYTLSVGLHHLLAIAYDGEKGQREFGMVSRLGRKAVLDLIALVGAEAFFIQRQVVEEKEEEEVPRKRMTRMMPVVEPEDKIKPLERATEFTAPIAGNELEKVELEAISEDMFDASLFDQLNNIDSDTAEDLFSLENLEGLAANLKSQKTLSEEEARQLGILGND